MDAMNKAKSELERVKLQFQSLRAEEARKTAGLRAAEKNLKDLIERTERAAAEVESMKKATAECAELCAPAEALFNARAILLKAAEREDRVAEIHKAIEDAAKTNASPTRLEQLRLQLNAATAELLPEEKRRAEVAAAESEIRLANIRDREKNARELKELRAKLDHAEKQLDALRESEATAKRKTEDATVEVSRLKESLRAVESKLATVPAAPAAPSPRGAP